MVLDILPLKESSTYNNANSIPRIRDGAMRSGWTDSFYYIIFYTITKVILLFIKIKINTIILINATQILKRIGL
jgi:hypothetical protein